MAFVPVQQTMATAPTFIQVGPGMLWTNVTKPGDTATLLVSGYASGPMDQRLYGPAPFTVSGTFIGSTIGDSSITYRPTFVDIMIETSTAIVEKILNSEDARCSFSVAEMTSENMLLAVPVGTLDAVTTDPLMSPQSRHTLRVGGLRLVAPMCIAFISPNRRIGAGGGPHSYVFCGYAAVSTDGFDAPFSRGRETVWKLTYQLIADTSRSLGDQLCQFTTRQ